MKNSGVEWIGEIPDDWDCIRFKYIFSILGGCGFKEEYQGQGMGNFPFCKASDINGSDKYVSNANNYVNEDLVKKENYTVIPKNSILISKIGEALKKNHRKINTVDCIVDSNCEAFVLISKNDISYFYYVLKCIDMNWFDNGGTIPSINNRKLLNFSLPFINLATQQKIAAYLDSKCSKIEETIRNQQQVIEKLKAYKQSLITEAVTGKIKIQNSKAYGKYEEYKDSGVEWIGKIPSGWDIKKFKFIVNSFKKGNGITKDEVFADGDTLCVRYGELYTKYNYSFTECFSKTKKDVLQTLQYFSYGDILFTCTGELIEEIGKNTVYLGTKKCLAGGDLIIASHSQNPTFLSYALNSDYAQTQKSMGKAKLKVVHISAREIGNILTILPPIDEQEKIANFLDKQCIAIDSAIEQKQNLIEKLTEYKKSLIYECVTGKKEV